MKRTLPEGHTVEYGHLRNYDNDGHLLAKGGITTAHIFKGEKIVAYATARCSDSENFCKARGRIISLGRALAVLDGTDTERKQRKLDAERLAAGVTAEEIHDAALYV